MKWSTSKKILIWGGLSSIILVGTLLLVRPKTKYGCSNSFLFLGDSITANSNGYVEMLKSQCPTSKIKKISKVGAQSGWILNEYKKELNKGGKHDVVNILIGVNDVFGGRNSNKTKSNIQEVINLANNNGSKVVFISSPSVKFYSKTTPEKLRLMTDLEVWARGNKGIHHFINARQSTEDRGLFSPDFLHLNNKGHQVIYSFV